MLRYILILLYSLTSLISYAQIEAPADRKVTSVPGQPFLQVQTSYNDISLSYFISEFEQTDKKPLLVYIQGSGCKSHFIKQNQRLVPAGGHFTFWEVFYPSSHILLVEKPGVSLGDNPSDCRSADTFNEYFDLDFWSIHIKKAIIDAQKVLGIENTQIRMIGHSEGGIVAAKVASESSEDISHVAILAGGGISQLYDLIYLAEEGNNFMHVSKDPSERKEYVLQRWQNIKNNPNNPHQFFFGFSYKRWYSFMSVSTLGFLKEYSGNVFIGQGGKDKAVNPESARILYYALISKDKSPEFLFLDEADHSFYEEKRPEYNGWNAVIMKISDWIDQSS